MFQSSKKIYRLIRRTVIRLFILTFGFITLLLVLNKVSPLTFNTEYSTMIMAKDSTVLHAFLTSDDKWRMKTELEEITPELKKAIVFKEDKYFYSHFGINPFSVFRAFFSNIRQGKRTSGASTITMQVARLIAPKDRTYWNKIKEMFRALQLEWYYSKDEILQLYLNLIPFGSNLEGVKSASMIFLKKAPDHLSLAELTTLAIIPNRPSSLRLGKNNDVIVLERNKWLERFKSAELFDPQVIKDAMEEPFDAQRHEAPKHAPHFSLRLKNMGVIDPIVNTTLDFDLQKKVEKLVKVYVNQLRTMNIRNAAVLVMNNQSHTIEAYVGSSDFYNSQDAGQVDGVKAVRSPGSTLKPLLYACSFDKGIITPKRLITDVPVSYSGYEPENYDQKYHGNVSIDFALANSLNIPAVKVLSMVKISSLLDKLKKAQFTQIDSDAHKLGLSMILGGCGVKLEELTNLYSTFANYGKYRQPKWLQSQEADTGIQLVTPASAFMITEILTTLTRPDLPVSWRSTAHMPKIAWKTGTSYGRRDAWSIGYNKAYTVGVWVGNFSAEGVPGLSGAEIATPLLFNIFNTIDYDSPNEWYSAPENLDYRLVCSESGFLPQYFCANTVLDTYIPTISTNQFCRHLKEVSVSPDSSRSYCTTCRPEAGYIKKLYHNYFPEIIAYFEQQQINYQKIPSHNPECERIFSGNEPEIISPVKGIEYYIDKADSQQLMLAAHVANDVENVFWYINNRFYRSSPAKIPVFFTPVSGRVKISCTDDKGRNSNSWVSIKFVNL